MARQIVSQTSFTGGEISPRLIGRDGTEEYNKSLKTATNCTLIPQGPVRKRSGIKFSAEVKDSSAKVALIKYQANQSVAFILEFGNLYIRFFKSTGQVTESDLTITGITQANPGVVTSASHGLANGDHVYITEVVGMTEVNNATIPYKVANVTTNTFELNDVDDNAIDTSGFTAYTSGGVINRIYEIVSPYTTVQVPDIRVRQIGATMYLTNPAVSQRKLVRTSDTSWTITEVDFSPPPTYEAGFSPSATLTPSATTGTGINFTASSGVFLEGDVGRQIINEETGGSGRASIISFTSTTVVVCDILDAFDDTSAIASGDWRMDLRPIVDLEFDTLQSGAIVNVRSEHTSGSLGSKNTISGITNANPAVVTSTSHTLTDGDKVVIQDVVGMTQLNDRIFTVDNSGANDFELNGENSTNYVTYSSGGFARRLLTDVGVDAFRAADVGKYILANGGVLQIVSVNSAQDIDCEIIKSMNSTDSTGIWTLETETWDATRGFPVAISFFNQRIVYGGTTAQPQNLWMSELGLFESFGVGPDDEDAIELTLASDQANEISWIAAGRDLVIGTSGGELTVSSGGTGSISPSSNFQLPRTYHGSDSHRVANIRDEIIFIQGSGTKIRTFRYDFNIDNYTGEELTFLSPQFTDNDPVLEIAYAQEPNRTLYCVTTDGNLLGCIYDRSKQILGWTKFTTDGNFESVATISVSTVDQVWVEVKRTINSSTKRYIEMLTEGTGEDDLDGFVDSFLTLSNPKTITGITNASPAVATSTAHGFSNGDSVVIKDLVDPLESELDSTKTNMSDINQSVFTIANVTANTFELGTLDTSNYNAYGSGGNAFERVTTVSGLDHLEGKTVTILGDGAVQPTKTVASGSITLETAAGEVVVGLPYTFTIETLSVAFNTNLGDAIGQRQRWVRPLIQVNKSSLPLLNGVIVPSRFASFKMGQKVPLFTDTIEYGPQTWSDTSSLTFTSTDPLPVEILAVRGTVDSGVK